MRTCSRGGIAEVATMCESAREPIRMHIAGVTYRMNAEEAMQLANKLADAVANANAGITTYRGE